jgi:hypothetical protein
MLLRIGIKGKFEDIEKYIIFDDNDNQRMIHDLSSIVELNEIINIDNIFFKELNVPTYYYLKDEIIEGMDEEGNDTTTITTNVIYREWTPEYGLYLIPNETYEYIIDLVEVDFITNEPNHPKVFDKYICNNTGISNITNTNVIKDYVYEWNGDEWILISEDKSEFKYITTYEYVEWENSELTLSGNFYDFKVNFEYPGKPDNLTFLESLTDEQKIERINYLNSIGYTEQIKFINGELVSPFEGNIYKFNPIVVGYSSYEDESEGVISDTHLDINKFNGIKNNIDNPHLINFTCIKLKTHFEPNINYIQSLQVQNNLEDLKNLVDKFLERCIDRRAWYYQNKLIDEYNELREKWEMN